MSKSSSHEQKLMGVSASTFSLTSVESENHQNYSSICNGPASSALMSEIHSATNSEQEVTLECQECEAWSRVGLTPSVLTRKHVSFDEESFPSPPPPQPLMFSALQISEEGTIRAADESYLLTPCLDSFCSLTLEERSSPCDENVSNKSITTLRACAKRLDTVGNEPPLFQVLKTPPPVAFSPSFVVNV